MQKNFLKSKKTQISVFVLVVGFLAALFGQSKLLFSARAATSTVHLTQCGELTQADTKYILDNDLHSAGTCLKINPYVQTANVEVDLNTHTIFYDEAITTDPINADFEDKMPGSAVLDGDGVKTWPITSTTAVNGWTFNDINLFPEAAIKETTKKYTHGAQYLYLGKVNNGGSLISSWVTLPQNVPAVSYWGAINSDKWSYVTPPLWTQEIQFIPDGADSGDPAQIVSVKKDENNSLPGNILFNTDATRTGRYRVVLTLVNGNGFVFNSGMSGFSSLPGYDQFGLVPQSSYGIYANNKNNLTVHGGSITQGSAKSNKGDGIYFYSTSNVSVHDIVFTNAGAEASAVYFNYGSGISFLNNTVNNTSPVKFNRMQISAAAMFLNQSNVEVGGNTISSGTSWGGIFASGGSTYDIHNNTVRTETTLTNHHGIAVYGTSFVKIRSNIITADPGQGILFSVSTDGEINNNTVTIDRTGPNNEYGVMETDAMTIKDYGAGTCKNVKLHDNAIIINGRTLPGYSLVLSGSTYNGQINGIMAMCGGGNVQYYNNTITAHHIDNVFVNGIQPGGIQDTEVIFYNNTVESDDSDVILGGYAMSGSYPKYGNVKLISNTFKKGTNAQPGFTGFKLLRSAITMLTDKMHFIDSRLEGGTTQDLNVTGYCGIDYKYNVDWYLNVAVKDVSGNPAVGATVSITDINNAMVYSGTTGTNGLLSRIILKEFYNMYDKTKSKNILTAYNPYTITATFPDNTVQTQQITMNKSQIVTFQLGSVPSLSDMGAFAPLGLDVASPPAVFNALPGGRLNYQTTSTTLSVQTNKSATCRYATAPGVAFGTMSAGSEFTKAALGTDGTMKHSVVVSGLSPGSSYSYYVKCQDDYGNISMEDSQITFTVNTVPDLSIPTTPNITPDLNGDGILPKFFSKMGSDNEVLNTPITSDTVKNVLGSGDEKIEYVTGVDGNAIKYSGATAGQGAYTTLGAENFDIADLDNNGGVLEFWLKFNFDPHAYNNINFGDSLNGGEKFLGGSNGFGSSAEPFMIERYGSDPSFLIFEANKGLNPDSSRFYVTTSGWDKWNSWQQDEWHKVTLFWKRNSDQGEKKAEMHLFIDGTQEGCPATKCNAYNGYLPPNPAPLYLGNLTNYKANITIDELKTFNAYKTLPFLASGAPVTNTSLNGGTYVGARDIFLNCIPSGAPCAKTYYTTDGSVPTTSSAVFSNASPVHVTGATTIKFFSVDTQNNTENVKSVYFTVNARKFSLPDFVSLTANWLRTGAGNPADINTDNVVDVKDLGVIMSSWQ